tara:strand:+ start:141 stop:1586 length:1446 start_codon:yes stop_codon:yes gene_type:complete
MSIIIEQQPLYKTLPVGQDIVFSISDNTIVANNYNVKFVAEIYVSNSNANLNILSNRIAVLKTTPNNAGVGIFSLQSVLESYVKPDNNGNDFLNGSTYKTVTYSNTTPHPIHLIDKYVNSGNATKYFMVEFFLEYSPTIDGVVTIDQSNSVLSEPRLFYNGYLNFNDVLKQTGNNYGYDLNADKLLFNDFNSALGKFLSNAPTTQYAKLTDYGTLPFFNFLSVADYSFQIGIDGVAIYKVQYIALKFYDSSNTLLATSTPFANFTNGAATTPNQYSNCRLNYFGAFPANLDNYNTTWQTHKANVSYYTIQAYDDQGEKISQLYTIKIIQGDCKGFESVRLTWLNPHGVWDYYTFTKKSVKSLQTNRTSYTQLGGTWNESTYKINGFKGGKKNFRVNSKELVTINTDFLVDADAVWFEELINSPEVYILNGFSSDDNGMVNKYVEPVIITTSSYTRKTKVNNKLIQYTFELEKSKNNRIQSA